MIKTLLSQKERKTLNGVTNENPLQISIYPHFVLLSSP